MLHVFVVRRPPILEFFSIVERMREFERVEKYILFLEENSKLPKPLFIWFIGRNEDDIYIWNKGFGEELAKTNFPIYQV